MSDSIKLFGTRILVKEFIKEKSNELSKSEGGIYLPATQQNPAERLFTGQVIIVGDECKKVKKGDSIVYDKMGPAPFIVGEETYEMVDETAIIGVYPIA